jgi:hypothetical protein
MNSAIHRRLDEALAAIDTAARSVLTDRFLHNMPLRILAAQRDISVPTASRQVARAIRQLAEVLREMGVAPADDRAVAEHLGDAFAADDPVERDDRDHGELRFAPDWRCAELMPLGVASAPPLFSGWSRPLRVGALVSYDSTLVFGANRKQMSATAQVQSTTVFPQPGIQLVAVVEPASAHRGIIECTIRDYEIIGGLIEADDVAGLQTLDVLLLGINWSMSRSVARAINQAVRGGMGLLNEYWTATQSDSADDPAVVELMLADSVYHNYHMPGQCGLPLPATVLREHALLPGLKANTKMAVSGCGPAYRVRPDAQVLVSKDYVIPPAEHGISGVGPLTMPGYIVGQLGRGRVVVNHLWPARGRNILPHPMFDLSRHLDIDREHYFLKLLHWLASPRQVCA